MQTPFTKICLLFAGAGIFFSETAVMPIDHESAFYSPSHHELRLQPTHFTDDVDSFAFYLGTDAQSLMLRAQALEISRKFVGESLTLSVTDAQKEADVFIQRLLVANTGVPIVPTLALLEADYSFSWAYGVIDLSPNAYAVLSALIVQIFIDNEIFYRSWIARNRSGGSSYFEGVPRPDPSPLSQITVPTAMFYRRDDVRQQLLDASSIFAKKSCLPREFLSELELAVSKSAGLNLDRTILLIDMKKSLED